MWIFYKWKFLNFVLKYLNWRVEKTWWNQCKYPVFLNCYFLTWAMWRYWWIYFGLVVMWPFGLNFLQNLKNLFFQVLLWIDTCCFVNRHAGQVGKTLTRVIPVVDSRGSMDHLYLEKSHRDNFVQFCDDSLMTYYIGAIVSCVYWLRILPRLARHDQKN